MHLQYTALLWLLSLVLLCGASPSRHFVGSSEAPPPLTGGLLGVILHPDSTPSPDSPEDQPLTGEIYRASHRPHYTFPPYDPDHPFTFDPSLGLGGILIRDSTTSKPVDLGGEYNRDSDTSSSSSASYST